MTIQNLNHYYSREFRECYLLLKKIKAANPSDRAIEVYIRRCARLIKYGVPEGWEGVEIVEVK